MRLLTLSALALAVAVTCQVPATEPDATTLVGNQSFLDGYPARHADETVHVVVEIPAGTTDKWEVDKADGAMRWEIKNGAPRVVRYLGYPGNYGMIPRTLLPKELGGDGDPLDVIVLGPAVPRGAVVRARVIGVLELLDGGEQDDKLLAVQEGSALAECADLADLDARFPGVTTIVETWFANYKGPGEIETGGFADRTRALEILAAAAAAFEARGGASEAAPVTGVARKP
jgi:inorganic pyrophosphatase